ncbi:ABC transporter substrate-binding protein [Siminovitchia sediminis]|uniref:ABC transporter substrate-binding protein n=1 Tax=Siminovitchia sediminis TaxID=1274353 RepID=A0ABW4KKF6_9BACI
MKRKWKRSAMALFSGAILMLAACGNNSSAPEEESSTDQPAQEEEAQKYTIGVTQIVEHPSLNAAFDGFKAALEEAGIDAEYDVQIAQGDNSANTSIANNLVSAGVDLIFANSTPSAQAAASATSDIPIIFTSVTDAEGAELVESNENPGGNVTGTVDTHPDAIPNTLKFLKEELNAEKVGMVFNSGEQNSRAQVDSIKQLIEDEGLGLEIVEASVATSADVKQAAESLVGSVDSMYTITDNTVVSALESVVSVANDNNIPMMVGEFDSVERGGFGAYGFEYYDIGYEAGQMAVKVLKGESEPAEMPVQYPQNLKFVINKETADAVGIEIKDEWNAEDVKELEK